MAKRGVFRIFQVEHLTLGAATGPMSLAVPDLHPGPQCSSEISL